MITQFQHERFLVDLLPSFLKNSIDNTFTVIVGKNGIGKSRLLSALARPHTKSDYFEFKSIERTIAISTSPFDKFPLPKKELRPDEAYDYRYVGMRRGLGTPSSITLITSAAKALLSNQQERMSYRLVEIFELLGLEPRMEFVFKINPLEKFKFASNYRSYENPEIPVNIDIDYQNDFSSFDFEEVGNVFRELEQFADHNGNFTIHYEVNYSSFYIKGGASFQNEFLEKILKLWDQNLLKLMDLRLDKREFGAMSLRRASSGEQCILVSMLGIAGHITDNSLILIDEPEISLHPEWQEQYPQLLVNTFSHYRGCQFVIATHSPLIVANLPSEHCFVLSLTQNDLQPSDKFRNKSTDFQLAELFETPGTSNEYLNRIALNLFSKISHNKNLDNIDYVMLDKLISMKSKLTIETPLFDLVTSLEMMKDYYAND